LSVFWRAHISQNPPQVDFTANIVLLVDVIEGSNGFDIHVLRVVDDGRVVTVQALKTIPGRCCGVGAVVTHPATLVSVPLHGDRMYQLSAVSKSAFDCVCA
jgi:hypothetical protein